MAFMYVRLKFRLFQKRLEAVGSSTNEDSLHHFDSLYLLDPIITSDTKKVFQFILSLMSPSTQKIENTKTKNKEKEKYAGRQTDVPNDSTRTIFEKGE